MARLRLRESTSSLNQSTSRSLLPEQTNQGLSNDVDKENRGGRTAKAAAMSTTSSSAEVDEGHRSRSASQDIAEANVTNSAIRYFDPNQNLDERRRIRKGLRDLNKEAQESRNEWLAPESNGIQNVVLRANELFSSVKQTADATIDSRLLVTAGDLTYRKTSQIVLGEGAQGVDVDEFVSKCITYMRIGAGGRDNLRQRSQLPGSRAAADEDSDHEMSGDPGDALDWQWLGASACFPNNCRPPVPGFLLGPLSLQRRSRAPRARRDRLQKAAHVEAARPDELNAADLASAESSDVKGICTKIHNRLKNIIGAGQKKIEDVYTENMDQGEVRRLLEENNLASDGGVPLFRFVLNPTSFGQTVENLFYVSFLIKDGAIGVQSDDNGMPSLHNALPAQGEAEADSNSARARVEKHQAVLSLDYSAWEELVSLLRIKDCLIPDRSEEETSMSVGSSQWYG